MEAPQTPAQPEVSVTLRDRATDSPSPRVPRVDFEREPGAATAAAKDLPATHARGDRAVLDI